MNTYPHQDASPEALTTRERESESTVGLLRRLMDELSMLFRQEVALARAEFVESLAAAKAGVASVAAGGTVLFGALLVLLAAAVLGLAEVMAAWLAALIVGLVVGITGYLMLQAGRRKLDPAALKPTHLPHSLRRDAEVLARKAR